MTTLSYSPRRMTGPAMMTFAYRPAMIGGRRFCKHIMAMAIHNRVNGDPQ